MGLFKRRNVAPASSVAPLQVPDELAQRAQIKYGSAEFVAAAELYSKAVDKLHTMYVIGECKHRQPSRADASITEGLVSAVGAALAMDPNAPVRPLAEQSIGYLSQIIELPQAKSVFDLYEDAISKLSRAVR